MMHGALLFNEPITCDLCKETFAQADQEYRQRDHGHDVCNFKEGA